VAGNQAGRRRIWLLLFLSVVLSACSLVPPEPPGPVDLETRPPISQATPVPRTPLPAPPSDEPSTPLAPTHIAQVWANEGADKVTRDELRATNDRNAVLNSVWNGSSISLFGARNEVVSFNLVLEAPTSEATDVDVTLAQLVGPDGAAITGRPATGDDLFNYMGRNIELFYVRYLEIRGLSVDLAYSSYDERHIPERCRRPYDRETGEGSGGWEDRPCHNRFYPEIAVPIELHSPFTIAGGTNQSIWGDIYIPKTSPAGTYVGTVEVMESGMPTWQIPIRLQVRNLTLPDLPNARTMLDYSVENANDRYLGVAYPEYGTPAYTQSLKVADRHFQLAHRHKISLINGGDMEVEGMDEAWLSRLTGELFTPAQGYDGAGVGVGNNVFSIGTYGSWSWQSGSREDMWANTDAWVNWFEGQDLATPTETFLYLIDESDDYPQIEEWARWMDENPGAGQRLMSMATLDLPAAEEETPSLDIPTSGSQFGIAQEWQSAANRYASNPDKLFYMYNGTRPATGSFATEDDGVALRMIGWAQFKMKVDRWFYWQSNYYVNYQCYGYDDPKAQTNVFQQAQTFGCYEDDDVLGREGWNYFNGDGVLFYPGTDRRYPEESYGLMGPLASLRLKHWRRGIQDVDYLALAAEIDPQRTSEIVQAMIPQVLWEYGVTDPEDPTYVLTDISWSTDPDVWEAARAELADIIEAASP
jgi:hypothetical protein